MFKKSLVITVFLTLSLFSSSVFALIGVGIHWGNDFTLRMDDVTGEQVSMDALEIDARSIGTVPVEDLYTITADLLPLYINRESWDRTPLNLGVKVYLDIIPFIDAVELSTNFAWWEYDGSIMFPSEIRYKEDVSEVNGPEDLFEAQYDTLPVTLDRFDMDFWGFHKTPYMKLQFDLTVRKYIYQFPPAVKSVKLYGGAGMSLIFSTPLLSSKLIEDALKSNLEETTTIEDLRSGVFDHYDVSKQIIEEITSNLMIPHWGCHLDFGAMVKLPVIPVGIYIDGKILIPFEEPDSKVDIGGAGFLFNTGVCLHF